MRAPRLADPRPRAFGVIASLVVSLALFAPARASADAIDSDWEPPECGPGPTCPDGSAPVGLGHSGCPSYCQPSAECTTAADCPASAFGAGATCVPTRFCVVPRSSGPAMSETVVDACEPTGPCGDPSLPDARDAQCSETSRCVMAPGFLESLRQPPARGGCSGCGVAGAMHHDVAAVAITVLVLGALRARRRRHDAETREPSHVA